MTAVLDRIPVEAIRTEAGRIKLGRLLLTVFVGIFWALGYTARLLTRTVAFAFAAARVGWNDGAPKTRGAITTPGGFSHHPGGDDEWSGS